MKQTVSNMLHNTGAYGPNETPMNVGAGVNINPLSGHVNIAHNINNLSKITHQTAPGPSGHYNLPDYGHYDPSALGMPPQMSPYPSYQHLGFQSNYMAQNSHHINELAWQNSMFPMNMNIQSDHTQTMMNYAFDKRMTESSRYDHIKEQNVRPLPLNIPQMANRQVIKPLHTPDYFYEKQERTNNFVQSSINQNLDHNLDLSMKHEDRMKIDTRRKNIENTVRLIEDILIHSSNKPKNVPKQNHIVYNNTSEYEDTSQESIENLTMPKLTNNIEKAIPMPIPVTENKAHTVIKDPLALTVELEKPSHDNINIQTPATNSQEGYNILKNRLETAKTEVKQTLPQQNTDLSKRIDVKLEELSWSYNEYLQPFLKDVNGFTRDNNYDCKIISENCVDEAISYIRHDIKPEGYFECPNCSLLFSHPKRFLIHIKWHSFGLTNAKRMESQREKEKEKFERKEAKMLERVNCKDISEMEPDKMFNCKDCEAVFCSKSMLKNHRQKEHATRVRDCKICHKTVVGWMALRAHLNTHAAENGYQCSDCPKRFKYAHSLAKHSDTHLEKIHGCQECPKKFGSQKLLKMHMKTHERQQRGTTFRCSYCGKGFFESYNLQVHERTHRNERPFLCEICNTSYGTNSSLKRHLKVSHSTDKPYSCSVCHRNFSTEAIRDRHEQRLHGNPEDFKFPCKLCDSKYLKHKDLQKHLYKVHPKGKRKKKGAKSDSE